MDAEKIIDEIFQGKCYQMENMRLVGVGEKVRCSVNGRGVAMIERELAADFVRSAVAAGKYICRRP